MPFITRLSPERCRLAVRREPCPVRFSTTCTGQRSAGIASGGCRLSICYGACAGQAVGRWSPLGCFPGRRVVPESRPVDREETTMAWHTQTADRRKLSAAAVIAVGLASLAAAQPAAAIGAEAGERPTARFAPCNASLNRGAPGALVADLSTPGNAQAQTIAEIVQRARPDVLLINEFDFVEGGVAAQLFQQNYLSVPHNGANPIEYGYRFVAPSNTGIASGFDLNNNGQIVTTPGAPGYGDDALGFGAFPGQFGM